ncbi:MAG: Wzz/FepE/Etk N-terminal domain-containing protein, partial [Nitrospinota bacterium]|nr:Wzz/FepE/Etk N-terminal domain-containing protein [Nitrospinota bacterium]
MEENTVELFDYLRVVWKRKILIIVVILVCLGIGVGIGVMNSMLKLPPVTSYQADAVVKIGQKLILTQSSGVSAQVESVESPADLERIIPHKYGFKAKNPLG